MREHQRHNNKWPVHNRKKCRKNQNEPKPLQWFLNSSMNSTDLQKSVEAMKLNKIPESALDPADKLINRNITLVFPKGTGRGVW